MAQGYQGGEVRKSEEKKDVSYPVCVEIFQI